MADRSILVTAGIIVGVIIAGLILGGVIITILWLFFSGDKEGVSPSGGCANNGESFLSGKPCCTGLIQGTNGVCTGGTGGGGTGGGGTGGGGGGGGTGNRYTLNMNLTGADVFNSIGPGKKFRFFTDADPTHGYVNYGPHQDLLSVVEGTKLRINMGTNKGQPRRSIRLESNDTFDTGLLVFDVDHVPADKGSWPAFWTTGATNPEDTWALNGEIDILEQVNNSNFNSSTLHTNTPPGGIPCKMADNLGFGGKNKCYAEGGDKTCGYRKSDWCPYIGCGRDMGSDTFGEAVNRNGGGTYAMELTKEGTITVWFWKRSETVPDFLTMTSNNFTGADPRNIIRFTPCPGQFKRQRIIVNNTLCGDWASIEGGSDWTNDAGCRAYIDTHDLNNSYWIFRSIKLYNIV